MDKIDIITDPEAHRTRILSSRRFGGLREGMQTVPLCVCVCVCVCVFFTMTVCVSVNLSLKYCQTKWSSLWRLGWRSCHSTSHFILSAITVWLAR